MFTNTSVETSGKAAGSLPSEREKSRPCESLTPGTYPLEHGQTESPHPALRGF